MIVNVSGYLCIAGTNLSMTIGWQNQGYTCFIVTRTSTEKVGLKDWRIGKRKKEGKNEGKVANRVGRFQSRAVSTVRTDSKASDDFCFTIWKSWFLLKHVIFPAGFLKAQGGGKRCN